MKYPHSWNLAMESPWCVSEGTLGPLAAVIAERLAGRHLDAADESVAQLIEAAGRAGSSRRVRAGSVAVIPLAGVLLPKAGPLEEMFGAMGMEGFRAELDAAVRDPEVDAVLLNVDSPGGSVALMSETAAAIRAAREEKPVWAVANTNALSAAYWLASQADRLYVTPSGLVGAIGVYTIHQNVAKALEKMGVDATVIRAGARKALDHPVEGEGLTDEARAEIQDRIDEFYGMFVADVALGRGVTLDRVTGSFGEGAVITASNAVDAGMVDGVASFDDVLKMVGAHAAGGFEPAATGVAPPSYSQSFIEQAEEAHDAIRGLLDRTRSLAEVRRENRLTNVKRDALTDLVGALEATTAELNGVLASTSKPDYRADLEREAVRFQAKRLLGECQ